MKFSLDDRGVSEVLGAILVFALLISVLSIIQVSGVPALNEQVEFEHNARVQEDMRDFASSVDDAAGTGRDQPVDIETGVRYPPRLFLINPGPTSGTVSTTTSGNVTFSNLEALDPEAGEYINSTNGPAPYTTTGLTYQPNYNQYNVAPETRYEHGIIYNLDDDAVSVMDRGSIISGKRISLTVVDGSIATSSGDSVSFTVVPVSGPSEPLAVRSADGNEMNITLPTALTQETWDELLADQKTDNNGYVSNVVVSNGEVTISLVGGVTYDLRLAKVAISGGVDPEPPAYVTTVPSIDTDVSERGGTLAASVRDQYNNPVSGVEVRFYSDNPPGTFPEGNTATTNADGIATVRFVPGTNAVTPDIYAGLDQTAQNSGNPFDNEPPVNYVKYTVSVTEANRPPTDDEINPVDQTALELIDVRLVEIGKGSDKYNVYEITYRNPNATVNITISEARVNFYYAAQPGQDGTPVNVSLTEKDTNNGIGEFRIQSGYKPFTNNIDVGPGGNVTLVATFYNDDGTIYKGVNTDEYFVLSLEENGSTRTYFLRAY